MNRKKLPEKWKVLKFKNCVVQLSTGLNPRKNFSLGHGSIRYITAKNLIGRGEIDFSTADYIDAEAKKIINKRSKIKAGDILFSSRAPIGQTYLISTEPSYFDIGESIFSIRANKEVITPEYLCLYLSSDYFIKSASKHVTGSVIQEIRIGNLMETEIVVPPIEMQTRITECINSIDYKIQLNNHINKQLESMAKTIYDYWFLQFEFPNEEGKPYKSSGGKMVWNEELKREIPEGWLVRNISDLCALGNGINYDKKATGDKTYKIVNVRDISASSLLINKQDMNEISLPSTLANKYLVNKDDILIARSGTPGAVRLVLDTDNVIYCGFIIHCLPNDFAHRFYLTFTLKLYEGTSATKTGGSILQNVSQDTLKSLTIPLPSKNVLSSFNSKIKPLIDKMQLCIEENNQLVSLRDFLLPMLMNGQVTFKGDDE